MKLNKSPQYLSTKEIQNKYHVSSATLRRWDSLGEISSIRTPGNHRLYNLGEIETLFQVKTKQGQHCSNKMSKRKERDENRPEKNVKEKRSTTHKDGLEYPFWWTHRTAQLSNRFLFQHKTSASVDTKTSWILKREHAIIGAKPFQVLKKLEATEEMKEVKHFAKRGEELKITEVMRSRKIEVKLSEDQKKHFRYWSDIYCFTYNLALEIFEREDYGDMVAYNKKGDPKVGTGSERLRNIVLDKERISSASEMEQKMLGMTEK